MSSVSTEKVDFLTFSISKEMNDGYVEDHIKESTTIYGSIAMLSHCNWFVIIWWCKLIDCNAQHGQKHDVCAIVTVLLLEFLGEFILLPLVQPNKDGRGILADFKNLMTNSVLWKQ